jgi:prevent-host-death family protein
MDGLMLIDEAVEQTDLPVIEEASEVVWEAVSGSQPALLTHRGRPTVVVLDLKTYTSFMAIRNISAGP